MTAQASYSTEGIGERRNVSCHLPLAIPQIPLGLFSERIAELLSPFSHS